MKEGLRFWTRWGHGRMTPTMKDCDGNAEANRAQPGRASTAFGRYMAGSPRWVCVAAGAGAADMFLF
jgi:hypothetical protein